MLKKLSVIIITVTILLTSACGVLLATPTPVATLGVPDTVVIELTWDQWADILCAIREIRGGTEFNLDTPEIQLNDSDIKKSRDLIARFEIIEDTLGEQADAQTADSPRQEVDAAVQHQIDRIDEYFNLAEAHHEAVRDWWTTQQTEEK